MSTIKNKNALVIGAGLAGLATAIRLNKEGFDVEILEKNNTSGGRLNIFEKDGYRFDLGPTFFSMSYILDEFIKETGIDLKLEMEPLDPLYTVRFRDDKRTFPIYRDHKKLAALFKDIEPDFEQKLDSYLKNTGHLFHGTFDLVVNRNFNTFAQYIFALMSSPMKHLPKLWRSFWDEVCTRFESDEARQIISLVAFFLGGTPFDTPAIYTLLSYTEFEHDGYHGIKGGMYQMVQSIEKIIIDKGIKINYNTEVKQLIEDTSGKVSACVDQNNKEWKADVFVVNSDAALFRGQVLKRKKYAEHKLRKMRWTMAPFTMYIGIKGEVENLELHNYFLGNNYKEYANTLFTKSFKDDQAYYYVNVPSMHNKNAAPEGCTSLFFLCPVPDLRFKASWDDKEAFAEKIIADFEKQMGVSISDRIETKTIMSPEVWKSRFNLYEGSGLGLAHNLGQMAWFRPKNRDEKYKNLYYTGASTIPGTGLPMVLISSKLTCEQIVKHHG